MGEFLSDIRSLCYPFPTTPQTMTKTTKLSESAKYFPLSPQILRHLAEVSLTQFSLFQPASVVQKPSRTMCSVLTQLGRAGSLLAEMRTISPLRSVRKGKLIHWFSFFFFSFLWYCLSMWRVLAFLWLRSINLFLKWRINFQNERKFVPSCVSL